MRKGFLITGLVLLLVANLLAMYGFRGKMFSRSSEGFASYFLENAGGAGKDYKPMGPFDGINVPTGTQSAWRYTAPNEPLQGPPVQLGPDNLFIFRNNQAKPECCGSTYSSDGGCVCTTPDQRQFLASRGGNRTVDDGI